MAKRKPKATKKVETLTHDSAARKHTAMNRSVSYPEYPAFLSQTVRELVTSVPWGHYANVLVKVTDTAARLYYLRATDEHGFTDPSICVHPCPSVVRLSCSGDIREF